MPTHPTVALARLGAILQGAVQHLEHRPGGFNATYDVFVRGVTFDIAESLVAAVGRAFVRTTSAGTILHRSTGTNVSEANKDLFAMHMGGEDDLATVEPEPAGSGSRPVG